MTEAVAARDAAALLAARDEPDSDHYRCASCSYMHDKGACGFWTGWRVGYVDCSLMSPDTTDPNTGHPDHYGLMALSRVVDADAHAALPEGHMYPLYTGRAAH